MTPWSDERHVAMLTTLYAEGLSCSQIATQINRAFSEASYTRNAVIGKLSRLGLSGRAAASAPTRAPKAPAVPRHSRAGAGVNMKGAKTGGAPAVVFGPISYEPKVPYITKAAAFDPLPGSSPKPWPERPFGECTWPVGGEGPDALSCCNPVHNRGWCRRHFDLGTARATAGRPTSANELMRSLRRHVAA